MIGMKMRKPTELHIETTIPDKIKSQTNTKKGEIETVKVDLIVRIQKLYGSQNKTWIL